MSGTFSGFTEDDIKKLNSENTKEKVKFQAHNLKKEKIFNSTNKNLKNNEITSKIITDMPEDAKLSIKKDIEVKLDTSPKIETTIVEIKPNHDDAIISTDSIIEKTKVEKIDLSSDTSALEAKANKLEEFEAKQKLIKEQNRKRKELLAKALADRTKKTCEEVRKLQEIKEEFKKLDDMLSNDVSVLRHEIEIASYDFMEAQKKYNKIEKEFLDAKLTLHQKLERKEMLTEHLCAIIEKNEERKAQKLLELMMKLEMEKNDSKLLEDISENVENEEKD